VAWPLAARAQQAPHMSSPTLDSRIALA